MLMVQRPGPDGGRSKLHAELQTASTRLSAKYAKERRQADELKPGVTKCWLKLEMKFASPEVAAAATSPQTGGAMPPSSTPCGSSPYCTPDPVQTRTNEVCVLNYNLRRFTTL